MWPGFSESPVPRRLAIATAGCVALPWLIGELFKIFHQSGFDNVALRSRQQIDFVVVGGIVFALTMWVTVTMGCWIWAVMHGPRHEGDPFPSGQGCCANDD